MQATACLNSVTYALKNTNIREITSASAGVKPVAPAFNNGRVSFTRCSFRQSLRTDARFLSQSTSRAIANRRSLIVQASEDEAEAAPEAEEEVVEEAAAPANTRSVWGMAAAKSSRLPKEKMDIPDSGRMGPPIAPQWDAVIEVGGNQQIVSTGRWYTCNNLNLEPGTEINLERVLLVKQGEELMIGQPYVQGATVQAKIIENYKDKKVIVYKMKPKKHTRKKNGHRQHMTKFMVTGVTVNA